MDPIVSWSFHPIRRNNFLLCDRLHRGTILYKAVRYIKHSLPVAPHILPWHCIWNAWCSQFAVRFTDCLTSNVEIFKTNYVTTPCLQFERKRFATARQRICGGVMFSVVSVHHSRGGRKCFLVGLIFISFCFCRLTTMSLATWTRNSPRTTGMWWSYIIWDWIISDIWRVL